MADENSHTFTNLANRQTNDRHETQLGISLLVIHCSVPWLCRAETHSCYPISKLGLSSTQLTKTQHLLSIHRVSTAIAANMHSATARAYLYYALAALVEQLPKRRSGCCTRVSLCPYMLKAPRRKVLPTARCAT